ncbi:hypothetical protein HGA34_04095 [Candidatus Falkowbacteria bacterium]|nr:hypothetical protein [Candidatus Falkowbacteria bacterium]
MNNGNPPQGPLEQARADQYKDLEGLSIKKLEFALWYTENKFKLYKLLAGVLLFIGLASWGYTLFSFGYYYVIGVDQDRMLANQIVATKGVDHDYILSISAKNLLAGTTQLLETANGKYDLVAQVENVNPRHWGLITYHFIVDGTPTPKADMFILPSESKRLMQLGQEFTPRPASAELVIDNVGWQRISKKTIPDWPAFKAKFLNFEITDKKFTPARTSGLSEKLSLSQLSFVAINRSSYNYLRVNFDAFIYVGQSLIGVNQFSVDNFQSDEKKEVAANFLGQFNRADNIEIVPNVNILDSGNFLKFNSAESLPTHPVEQ